MYVLLYTILGTYIALCSEAINKSKINQEKNKSKKIQQKRMNYPYLQIEEDKYIYFIYSNK
jgi:hypothetical protein